MAWALALCLDNVDTTRAVDTVGSLHIEAYKLHMLARHVRGCSEAGWDLQTHLLAVQ